MPHRRICEKCGESGKTLVWGECGPAARSLRNRVRQHGRVPDLSGVTVSLSFDGTLRYPGVMKLALLFLVFGCGDEPPAADAAEVQSAEEQATERPVPDWAEADMAVWRFAKERGVHGTDLSRRTMGEYEFLEVRELSDKVPPIHAGPSATPKLWVVRHGSEIFAMDDAAMAPLLMSKDVSVLLKVYVSKLTFMGAEDIHDVQQNQADGVTTLSWVHNRRTYPRNSDDWERVTVTANNDGTRIDGEDLSDYIRPE